MDIKIPRADTMRFNHSATLIQRDPNLTKWILTLYGMGGGGGGIHPPGSFLLITLKRLNGFE